MAVGVIVLTVMRILSPDNFMVLAAMAFSFYFSNKPTDSEGRITK